MYICVIAHFVVISMYNMCLCYIHCLCVTSYLVKFDCWTPIKNVQRYYKVQKSLSLDKLLYLFSCACLYFFYPRSSCLLMSDVLMVLIICFFVCFFFLSFFIFFFLFHFNLLIYFIYLFFVYLFIINLFYSSSKYDNGFLILWWVKVEWWRLSDEWWRRWFLYIFLFMSTWVSNGYFNMCYRKYTNICDSYFSQNPFLLEYVIWNGLLESLSLFLYICIYMTW